MASFSLGEFKKTRIRKKLFPSSEDQAQGTKSGKAKSDVAETPLRKQTGTKRAQAPDRIDEFTEEQKEEVKSFVEQVQDQIEPENFATLDVAALETLEKAAANQNTSKQDALRALNVLAQNPALVNLVEQFKQAVPLQLKGNEEPVVVAPPPQAAATAAAAKAENPLIRSITNDLNDILSRAMQPALTFIGKVAVRLRENDVRNLLAWNNNPSISMIDRLKVVQYADIVEEFIMLNRELGSDFLSFYLQSRLPSQPAAGGLASFKIQSLAPLDAQLPFNLDILVEQDKRSNLIQSRREQINLMQDEIASRKRAKLDATDADKAELEDLKTNLDLLKGLDLLGVSDLELQFAPAWAFECVNDAIFRRIWSTSSLAAVEAAAQAVRRIPGCKQFTTKELISSDQVSDQFAFLVSASYLNSGDGIPPAQTRGGRGGYRNSTYINIMAMRESLSQKIYTANIWFEQCVKRRANTVLLSLFDTETAKVLQAEPDANVREAQDQKYKALRKKLPQFVLVFSE